MKKKSLSTPPASTPEEKLTKLLEMQNHPERYTDEEIRQMMADEDCRQFYRQMVKATDAAFAEERAATSTPRLAPLSPLRKTAAAILGVLMLSGIAYAAIRYVQLSSHQTDEQPAATVTATAADNPAAHDGTAADSTKTMPVVFENVKLDSILRQVAAFYHCELVFKNEKAQRMRLYFTWDKTKPLDEVVETFNKFEKLNIIHKNQRLIVE